MGLWFSYHLTINPGERDTEAVADDLRVILQHDLPELCNDPTAPNVWTADEMVHASPGQPNTINDHPRTHHGHEMALPCKWALLVTTHEHGNACGSLFTWQDGEFALVDQCGRLHGHGADVLDYFKRRWDIEGGRVR